MRAVELKVYEILKTHFGQAEAETLMAYFEWKLVSKTGPKKDIYHLTLNTNDMDERKHKIEMKLMRWTFFAFLAFLLLVLLIIVFT